MNELPLPVQSGHVIVGTAFDEPMQVETVRQAGGDAWVLGLVGL
jgi:hypothetical protein